MKGDRNIMTEGNYIPLTDEAIDDVKEYLKKVVAYAEYRAFSHRG